MNDIVDAIDSIISVQGLMIEAEKELRTETEFLKNKKKKTYNNQSLLGLLKFQKVMKK